MFVRLWARLQRYPVTRNRWNDTAKLGWLMVVALLCISGIGYSAWAQHRQSKEICMAVASNRSLIKQIVILATTPVQANASERVSFINVQKEFVSLIPEGPEC